MKKILLGLILLSAIVSGCQMEVQGTNNETATKENPDNIKYYSLIKDETTGCVYIKYQGGNHFGLTSLVDDNGNSVGCNNTEYSYDYELKEEPKPFSPTQNYFNVIRDPNTGCSYLKYHGGNHVGITPYLNENGKPMGCGEL